MGYTHLHTQSPYTYAHTHTHNAYIHIHTYIHIHAHINIFNDAADILIDGPERFSMKGAVTLTGMCVYICMYVYI